MPKVEIGCRCGICEFWEMFGKSRDYRIGGCHNAKYNYRDGRSGKRLFNSPETYGCTLGVAADARS